MGKSSRVFLEVLIFIFMAYVPHINAGQSVNLEWLTPPPRVVVADIGQAYTIGCRLTFESSMDQYQDLKVNEVQLYAVVGKIPDKMSPAWDIELPEIGVHRSRQEKDHNNLIIISKLFEYKPTRRDSNMSFKCSASTENSEINTTWAPLLNHSPIAAQTFNVEYPPLGLGAFQEAQLSGNQVEITAVRGRQAFISIDFEAEPPPRIEQIKWHIVRDIADLSLQLLPGQIRHRFSASIPATEKQEYGDGSFTTKIGTQLLISDTRLEDQDDFFYLEVHNAHGRAEFRFSLNLVEDEPDISNFSTYEALSSSSITTSKYWSTVRIIGSISAALLLCNVL